MSEEEKHAIEFFNKVIYQIGEEDIMKNNCILLNLIDKLQKDNKELNLENQALYESINLEDNEYLAKKYQKLKKDYMILQAFYSNDYIRKDKIRAKIEELESKKEQYSEQPLIYHILKNQLEELLGE